MKMNKIAASLAFIALSVSSVAQANTIPMGTLTTGITVKTSMNVFGAFTDTFNFNVASTSDVTASIADLSQNMDFGYMILTVLKDNNLFMSLPYGASAGNNQSATMLNLAAGSYSAVVKGNAVGAAGGLYSVAMTAQPSAVPVPTAVWLLGSGLLGLVGIARRKEQA